MEKTRKIKVTAEQLQAFVRGELSFWKMTGTGEGADPNAIILTGDGDYQITLRDIVAGIRNYLERIKDRPESMEEFFDCWVLTICESAGDLMHFPELLGFPGETIGHVPFCGVMFLNQFFETETELASYVYAVLWELIDDRWKFEEKPESLEAELKDLLDVIANFPKNKGKKWSEWKLTKKQKQNFVYQNDGDRDLKKANQETVALWKKYLEELADNDDVNAVKILGYACYGDDHAVYSCDWVRSRDCMLKLLEIADDEWKAMAANTLGYIYYYGRTNGGIPEYDEAYKYFSLAAFFGYYEATYKVGDMLMGGKGTPKNETAAFRLYRFVYDDCLPRFLEDGIGAKFADAALRMGGAYHKGKGVQRDLMLAYRYYLEARVAIDNRMKRSDFFGDASVSTSIRSAISEIREELGGECRKKKCDVELGRFMNQTVFDGVETVKIRVERKKTETSITFLRIREVNWAPDPKILVTVPEISYCRLSPEIKLTAPACCRVEVAGSVAAEKAGKGKTGKAGAAAPKTFLADKVTVKKDEVLFYYRKKRVLTVDREGWYLKAEREKGPANGWTNPPRPVAVGASCT